VKGHKAASRIFTLRTSLELTDDAAWLDLKAAHDNFVASYRGGAWEQARWLLTALRERNVASLDGLYALYAARIDKLVTLAPEAWDGVFAFEEK
jgi:hypothetical protein